MKVKVCMILALVFAVTALIWANCVTIKDGTISYPAGHYFTTTVPVQFISSGYDDYGYNYQAHLFNGCYANVSLSKGGFPPYEGDDATYYQRLVVEGFAGTVAAAEALLLDKTSWASRDVTLVMKWNDAWLSNKDCKGDGVLDRSSPVIGSGAWDTNHQAGAYIGDDGKEHHWSYFVKIVAVPVDATWIDVNENGKKDTYVDLWETYSGSGVVIGKMIWGSYAIIQQVENDPYEGLHGLSYGSPVGPGLGKY